MNFQLIYQIESNGNILNKIIYFLISFFIFGFGIEKPKIADMSLKEKIAQMIMVRVRGDFYNSKSWYKKRLKNWIQEDGIGGVPKLVQGSIINFSRL